jgi:hypothetical protein
MPFIGNQPALSYTSFAKQDFTTSATTSYTLDHPVTNENEIALFINFVRQEPTTAYTASGTSLTLTSATSATDDMYCVFLGKAVQTVNPPNASVGTAQLGSEAVTNAKVASSIITGQTAETSIATDDLILLSDTSASGALRKMTRANFVSGIGGTMTPAFCAYLSANQTVSDATDTKCQFDTEVLDTDNCYDNSTNYRFTPTTAGKYFVYSQIACNANGANNFLLGTTTIKKNGSNIIYSQFDQRTTANGYSNTVQAAGIVDMNGSSDYLEVFGYIDDSDTGSSPRLSGNSTAQYSNFGAYKIIE